VSVELIRDLSWFGKGGMSMICIGASSKWNVPSCGLKVVNWWGDIFVSCFVNVLNRVDFPEFVNPARTTCMSAFFIPVCLPFPDFFCFAMFIFNFL